MESGVESRKWGKEYEERVDNHLGSGKNQAADHEHRFRKVIDVEAVKTLEKSGEFKQISPPICQKKPFPATIRLTRSGGVKPRSWTAAVTS